MPVRDSPGVPQAYAGTPGERYQQPNFAPPPTLPLHPQPPPARIPEPTSPPHTNLPPPPQSQQPTLSPPPPQTQQQSFQSPPLAQHPSPNAAPQPSSAHPPSLPRSTTPEPPKPHPSGVTPITECISDPVDFDLDWFFHPAAPSFSICTRCYVDHIYDTQYRDSFSQAFYNDKQPQRCLFGSKRMKDQIWPTAVSSRSLSEAIDFMQKRQNIPNCPGETVKEGQSWYVTDDIPHSTFCRACYEDGLLASPFGGRFRLESPAGGCFCDSSHMYVRRMLEKFSATNDWTAFATEVKARLQFPACPKGNAVKASERSWFVSKRTPKGLQVCVACYCDYFLETPNSDLFERMAPFTGNTSCMMRFFNILIPTQQTVIKKDWDLFSRAVGAVDNNVLCDAKGLTGATWYTLPSNPPDFGICGGCYGGIVKSLGGSHFFVPKYGVSPTTTLLCCFNPSHSRMGPYLLKYAEGLLHGTLKPLGEYAAVFSSVPRCPRSKLGLGKSRKWWGWADASICEDCYLTFAKGTRLESHFTNTGQLDPGVRICDLYSPRMRRLYTEACVTDNLAAFLAFAKHRMEVYMATIPECERILTQQRFAANQAQMLGIMGTTYKNMGGMQDAVMGHRYTVGNAALGYGFANGWSLTGAAYDQQAMAARMQVGGGAVMQVKMLEDRWLEVE
ncbi:hypothetical protein G7046_g9186 [Stylonectria norvegica]|nr:hypothetical protein G7046_g9186 [Stylonectria norvegica]